MTCDRRSQTLPEAGARLSMKYVGTGLILGIESSCDETAAAVVRGGRDVLSNAVSSQVAMHALYGGVVPELASREHLRNVVPVVREALRTAGVAYASLDAVAVTAGPGLAGALLVGISFAKALSFGLGKPLIAVNHLEGHIHAVLMQMEAGIEEDEPLLALVVSGGHTHLYVARRNGGAWSYRNVGRTVDDAAGEAYDKAAKMLGLPYPGGPWMDRFAEFGDANAVPFRLSELNRGTTEAPTFDFSFSGIKTAVLRYMQVNGMQAAAEKRRHAFEALQEPTLESGRALLDGAALNVVAGFQAAVVRNLVGRTTAAARHVGARTVVVSGGVAANRALRAGFAAAARREGFVAAFPTPALSTDNAAMIAAAAWPRFVAGEFAPDGLNAVPQMQLGEATNVAR